VLVQREVRRRHDRIDLFRAHYPALVPLPAAAREDDILRLYLRDQAGLQGLGAS